MKRKKRPTSPDRAAVVQKLGEELAAVVLGAFDNSKTIEERKAYALALSLKTGGAVIAKRLMFIEEWAEEIVLAVSLATLGTLALMDMLKDVLAAGVQNAGQQQQQQTQQRPAADKPAGDSGSGGGGKDKPH